MDSYSRAYRDPKSPLTPLTPFTPLTTQNVFNFNHMSTDQHSNKKKKAPFAQKSKRRSPKRYSAKFLQIRDVFENRQNSQLHCKLEVYTTTKHIKLTATPPLHKKTPKIHLEVPKRARKQPQQGQRSINAGHYLGASSIPLQPLSPRTADLLNKVGMVKYNSLFQREEIDIEVFRLLSLKDLIFLGITSHEEQMEFLKAIEFAHDFY